MKKLTLVLSMVLLCATFMSAKGDDYVKTANGIIYLKNMRFNLKSNCIGETINGEKLEFDKSEVLGYCKNGIQYEKMPVYKNNALTGEEEFMKVVSYRNGLKLYEYEYISKNTNSQARRYYVFKADKLVVEVDGTNKSTITAFFNRK